MAKNIDMTDPAFSADVDDDAEITAEELGNNGEGADAGITEGAPPAKKDKPKPEEEGEEEEEEEGEEEEEEEGEEEGEEEEDDAEKARMARKLARAGKARERLEQQLSELRQQVEKQTQERTDTAKAKFEKLSQELDELYEEVEELRADGKAKDAAKKQRRIDEIRDNMTRSQAALYATKEAMQQTELRAYNTMVQELEAIDPRFDEDHDDFDPEIVDTVGDLVEAYEAKGLSLPDALRKACRTVLREDLFSKSRPLKRDVPRKLVEKKKTDVAKNLKAAKKQPPDEPGASKDKATTVPDMSTISEKDYDALPEELKRRIEAGEFDDA